MADFLAALHTGRSAASEIVPPSVYRIIFDHCAHVALIPGDEYGDGSAWCQRCGAFQIYETCAKCGNFECESLRLYGEGHCSEATGSPLSKAAA